MRKTKSEGKTVEIFARIAKIENFANTSQCVRNLSEFRKAFSEFGKALANLARLRIWQGCEFGKVANFAS